VICPKLLENSICKSDIRNKFLDVTDCLLKISANVKGFVSGGEIEFRLPGTAADLKLFVEDKNCSSALLVLPEQPLKID
jgi:hypothetical protein